MDTRWSVMIDARLPVVSSFGLSGPIEGARGYNIINAYSRASFDRQLKGAPTELLEEPADLLPEVSLETSLH